MKEYKLTPEEHEIEEHADELVSLTDDERAKVESILERRRKSRPVAERSFAKSSLKPET